MPTEEEKLRSLKEQNAVIAQSSITLSNHIKDLEKEIPSLEKTRDDLFYKIKELEDSTKSRHDERQEELNQRGEALSFDEAEVGKREENVSAAEDNLKAQNQDLESRTKRCHEVEHNNSKATLELEIANKKTKKSQEILDKLIQEKQAQPAAKSLNADLQIQISEYTSKNREMDSLRNVYEQGIKANREAVANLAAKNKTLDEEIAKAKGITDRHKSLRSELNSAIESSNKAQKDYEAKLDDFADREKKLEYGWLRINKRIRDKALDISMEELRK